MDDVKDRLGDTPDETRGVDAVPAMAGERAPGPARDDGAMTGLCAAEGRAIANGEPPEVAGALEMTLLDDAGARERARAGRDGRGRDPAPEERADEAAHEPQSLARRTPAPPPSAFGL